MANNGFKDQTYVIFYGNSNKIDVIVALAQMLLPFCKPLTSK